MKEIFNRIRKYNFWDEANQEFGYYRTDYADKIFSYTNNRLIKVLVGQRRTGKSYILRQLIYKLLSSNISKNNILYINIWRMLF
jgi:predicted AAA+ superfamily ATPase